MPWTPTGNLRGPPGPTVVSTDTGNQARLGTDNFIYVLAVPTGVVLPFGGTTAPTGFLLCDFSEYDRVVFGPLFNVIGAKYGAGDGVTTFNVPDGRGKMLIGSGLTASELAKQFMFMSTGETWSWPNDPPYFEAAWIIKT